MSSLKIPIQVQRNYTYEYHQSEDYIEIPFQRVVSLLTNIALYVEKQLIFNIFRSANESVR